MTTTQIPAEHLQQLRTASDEQVRKVMDHNAKRAAKDWAAGRQGTARRWYAYVDACRTILQERDGTITRQASTGPASDRQVSYIANLLTRRTTEGGFSGLVSSLHTNGTPNLDAIRALTTAQASQVIDSLTGNY